MKNRHLTIKKIVESLNNTEEDGGFWLPNIQRPFVWKEDQIYRLFDSIMRQYPISTLLVWKTKSRIRYRKFIDHWRSDLRLTDFNVPEDTRRKTLVLDGQQRLQSLFIGIKGSFERRVLCFNLLSGDASPPDDIRYKFQFLSPREVVFPWVPFRKLIESRRNPRQLVKELWPERPLGEDERDRIEDNLHVVYQTFKADEAIAYQELDSIDDEGLYTEDDVVEVFIRANSGGTRLSRSDLLFSLLTSTWSQADEQMEDLLDSLNKHGFSFDRDFVMKTCLVLLNQGARYEVEKFRKEGIREKIEANWGRIADSIRDVLDFVRGKTFIQCDKALPSYLVLVPLVYLRYHFPEGWREAVGIQDYLLRCLLAAAFTGQPDTVIDAIVRTIRDRKGFDLKEVFGAVRSSNRSLEVTEERLFQIGYRSDLIYVLFNLWYKDFNFTPAYDGNLPQIDHIFPQAVLKSVKDFNPHTGRRDVLRYKKAVRDQLANCMLLTKEENSVANKGRTPPDQWLRQKDERYLKMHLIPDDPSLWKLERFEDFVEARKSLIREKFRNLLTKTSEEPSP